MKKILLGIFSILILSCNNTEKSPNSSNNEVVNAKINQSAVITTEFKVSGMTCEGCENTIKSNVGKIAGIVTVTASHTQGNAVVKFDTTLVSAFQIAEAINNTGYKTESYTNK